MNLYALTERTAWASGILALTLAGTVVLTGRVEARRELQRFAAMQAFAARGGEAPDFTRWSPERVRAWQDTHETEPPPPIAVLRIPRIDLTVSVLHGTAAWTLNRAVGHIEGTALPGGSGNVGIAGHRDGFFRRLEMVAAGDIIELETAGRVDRYRVDRTWIVAPEDVSVIEATESPSVTLVTCYPFYFVGSAPQRFIVRGVREGTAAGSGAPE